MIGMGQLAEAEARYLKLVAENPLLESPDVAKLIEAAKARPGALNYSSVGYGSASNLVGEMFNQSANIKAAHIPYKGEAPAITGLIGGEVEYTFVSPVAMPHIVSKRICPLAVTGNSRLALLPMVPTFNELGLKNMNFNVWYDLPNLKREGLATVSLVFTDNVGATFSKSVEVSIAP